MSFRDTFFLFCYIPLIVIYGYYVRKHAVKISVVVVLLLNTVFYLYGGISAFLFLLIYSIITYLACIICNKMTGQMMYGLMILILLLPLVVVKCTDLISTVPLGISFFSFQAISLLSDVHNSKTEKISLPNTIAYLSFFPTVSSGPICRYGAFRDNMAGLNLKDTDLNSGMFRFVTGLSKKLLIADKIAPLADYYFEGIAKGSQFSVIGLWVGSIAYTIQIYFDFSGYSDMAIGIGQILGFKIPENFNHPYISKSISDFWKRWHITLTDWFRDYIYIPLGGNRCSKIKHVFNMLIVWLLTSVWHGCNVTFLVWGLGYWLLLLAEKHLGWKSKLEKSIWGNLYTMFIVNMLWVAFRSSDIYTLTRYYRGMVCGDIYSCESVVIRYIPYLVALLVSGIVIKTCKRVVKHDRKIMTVLKQSIMVILFVLCVCVAINASYTPYVYGRF